MKIVQINSVCGSGSTGKICVAVSQLMSKEGIENYIFYANGSSEYPLGVKYMSEFEIKMQALKSRICGDYGFQSKNATRRLIKYLIKIAPDVVHLHNLHSHNVHLELLFKYFKEANIKVFWTFHDCWAFTSYCMYFDMVACDKWKYGCRNCPQRKKYSWLFDKSKSLYQKKKDLFTGLDMTIITPSQWLAGLVKQSFLCDIPVVVINNGIDLDLFKPTESDFREKYGIPKEKKILLGVANKWEKRKGLDVFIRLAETLEQEKFQIVLVGTNDGVDKQLPANVISIHRTSNQKELAEIYSAADLFVNPTREDNFPTVNLESLACGTPVIAFNTGGCAEMLNEYCGCIVPKNNVDQIYDSIHRVVSDSMISSEKCIAQAQKYKAEDKFIEYIKLYS